MHVPLVLFKSVMIHDTPAPCRFLVTVQCFLGGNSEERAQHAPIQCEYPPREMELGPFSVQEHIAVLRVASDDRLEDQEEQEGHTRLLGCSVDKVTHFFTVQDDAWHERPALVCSGGFTCIGEVCFVPGLLHVERNKQPHEALHSTRSRARSAKFRIFCDDVMTYHGSSPKISSTAWNTRTPLYEAACEASTDLVGT